MTSIAALISPETRASARAMVGRTPIVVHPEMPRSAPPMLITERAAAVDPSVCSCEPTVRRNPATGEPCIMHAASCALVAPYTSPHGCRHRPCARSRFCTVQVRFDAPEWPGPFEPAAAAGE